MRTIIGLQGKCEFEMGTGTEMGAETGTWMDNQMGGAAAPEPSLVILRDVPVMGDQKQQPSLC